ncbi:MAG TPA: cell division protein FtsQ/DivIB [Candidatus Goldiibacteriota bacterium]|nr:cell division protein FtsQ/DivIB [Candidatus Goldiibacteriota bacterium]
MPEYRLNFVKRKPSIKFAFVERRARVATGAAVPRGAAKAIRALFLSSIVLLLFVFAVNLIVKFGMERINVSLPEIRLPSAGGAKYFISRGNMYMVYADGREKIVDRNIDSASLPYLTGLPASGPRPEQKRAYKMALALKPDMLRNVSEVNISNPQNIIIITVDGKKILAGSELTGEKLENYHIALGRINRNYTVVDLRFKDRVIIK